MLKNTVVALAACVALFAASHAFAAGTPDFVITSAKLNAGGISPTIDVVVTNQGNGPALGVTVHEIDLLGTLVDMATWRSAPISKAYFTTGPLAAGYSATVRVAVPFGMLLQLQQRAGQAVSFNAIADSRNAVQEQVSLESFTINREDNNTLGFSAMLP